MAKQDPEEIARRLRQEAADEELAKLLDSDPDFAADFDKAEANLLRDVENGALHKIAREKKMSPQEEADMMAAADRARKAMKGGLFTSPNPEKAEQIIMSNRGLREARQRGKKSRNGCLKVVIPLFVLSASVAATSVWGAVELVSAVVR